MQANRLLTHAQMLAHANGELDKAFAALNDAHRLFSAAGDWLRPDWQPGSSLTKAQADAYDQTWETIFAGKRLIDEIKDVGGR